MVCLSYLRLPALLLLVMVCGSPPRVLASPADVDWQPFETVGDRFALRNGLKRAGDSALSVRARLPVGPGEQAAVTLYRQFLFHGAAPAGVRLPAVWAGVDQSGNQVRLLDHRGEIRLSIIRNRELSRLTGVSGDYSFTKEMEGPVECGVEGSPREAKSAAEKVAAAPAGWGLRAFVLLASATGEFTRSSGGTPEAAFARIAQRVNEANAVLEQELGLTLQLSTDSLGFMYTDSDADPFSDGNTDALIDQNHYMMSSSGISHDIGHNFHNGGGGRAYLSEACSRLRAGATSQDSLKVFLHEVGHQLGAEHTFSGSQGQCGPNRGALVEPGSGSTIMSYAGSCYGDNLQSAADLYFHQFSLKQMDWRAHRSCGTDIGPRRASPRAFARFNGSYVVPRDTPLLLVGAAADPDPEGGLTYGWEQTFGPAAIRSHIPAQDGFARAVPSLVTIDTGVDRLGDRFLYAGSPARLSLAARSGGFEHGTWSADDLDVTVDPQVGPFKVTAPTGHLSVTAGSSVKLTWNVAGTDGPPVNCAEVDVLLGDQGGLEMLLPVATGLPNAGSATITMPDVPVSSGRLWVACSTAPFASPAPATIWSTATGASAPVHLDVFPQSQQVCRDGTAHLGTWVRSPGPSAITLSAESELAVEIADSSPSPPESMGGVAVDTTGRAPGVYSVQLRATSSVAADEASVSVEVLSPLEAPAVTTPLAIATQTNAEMRAQLPVRADVYMFQDEFAGHPFPEPNLDDVWFGAPTDGRDVTMTVFSLDEEPGSITRFRVVALDRDCGEISISEPVSVCNGTPAVPPVLFPDISNQAEVEPMVQFYLDPDILAGGSYGDAMTMEVSADETFSAPTTYSSEGSETTQPLTSLRLSPGETFFYRTRSKSDCAENTSPVREVRVSTGHCIAAPQTVEFGETGEAWLDLPINAVGEADSYSVYVALSGFDDPAQIGIDLFRGESTDLSGHIASLQWPAGSSCPSTQSGAYWFSTDRHLEEGDVCAGTSMADASVRRAHSYPPIALDGSPWRVRLVDPTWMSGRSVTVDQLCLFAVPKAREPHIFASGFE